DLLAGAGLRIGSHGLLEERPGETQRQETKHKATQEEQKNVFQTVPARHARRGGLEKHQRTERHLLLARAPDEMKDNRQRDSQRAKQKQGRQEAHVGRSAGIRAVLERVGSRSKDARRTSGLEAGATLEDGSRILPDFDRSFASLHPLAQKVEQRQVQRPV